MTGINKQETSFQVHKMMVGYCGAWSTSILQIYIYRLNYLKLVGEVKEAELIHDSDQQFTIKFFYYT